MVLRAAKPRVIGKLVIVPRDDERMLPVNFLGVGISLVLGMAFPVILQRHGFFVGQRNSPEGGAVAVLLVGVLVDVVTEVHDGVNIGALRQAGECG